MIHPKKSDKIIRRTKSKSKNMKYLTMIIALAPAGIAAFSGIDLVTRTHVTTLELRQSNGAGTSSTVPSRRHAHGRCTTRLHYISGAEHQEQSAQASPWWNALFGKSRKSQQEVVDDYLEFLDRRYHRLRDDGEDTTEINKGSSFSVLSWLHQGSNSQPKSPEDEQKQEDDALHALGVAGLASQRLLQKHRLQRAASAEAELETAEASRPESAHQKTKGSTVQDGDILEKKTLPRASASAALDPALALFRRVGARRQVFLRNQSRQIRMALALILRSLSSANPIKALKKLFVIGGGQKTLALTLTVLTVCAVLFRPLLQMAVRESAQMHS